MGRTIRQVGFWFFVAVFLALLWRITQGVDFSDESYFAIFLDDWFKEGIARSPFLTLHQMAAMFVYPAAWIYKSVRGTTDGLFLFLRALFLLSSLLAARVWFLFTEKFFDRAAAWSSSIAVLSFIPFGTPAPSYNTLACQFLLIALGAFGCGAHDGEKRVRWWTISAFSWAIVVAAYPTLFLALLFFVCGLSFFLPFSSLRTYFLLLLGCQLLVGGWLVYSLSWQRILESVEYHAALIEISSFSKKISSAKTMFLGAKRYSLLVLFTLIIGILRPWIRASRFVWWILFLICFSSSFLWLRSHDAIFLASLSGLGIAFALFAKNEKDRLYALLFTTSFLAGLIISVTSYVGLFSFCVGGVPAACLSLLLLRSESKKLYFLSSSIFTAILICSSVFFRNGEPSSQKRNGRKWVKEGFFAGLSLCPEQFSLLEAVHKHVPKGTETALAVGKFPGLVLATGAKTRALIAYPLPPSIPDQALAFSRKYYQREENRPELVIVYRDPTFPTTNPIDPNFLSWYDHTGDNPTLMETISIYRLRKNQDISN